MTAFESFLKALNNTPSTEGILGDECLEYPPNEQVDYWATPQNAVVFGWMGVDGVHYAILKIDGQILDESPVIQIGPMDFDEPYSLLAPTFMDYLAIGCGVDRDSIQQLFADEDMGQSSLLEFMRSNFKQSRFLSPEVSHDIKPYAAMIIPKPDGEKDSNLDPFVDSNNQN